MRKWIGAGGSSGSAMRTSGSKLPAADSRCGAVAATSGAPRAGRRFQIETQSRKQHGPGVHRR